MLFNVKFACRKKKVEGGQSLFNTIYRKELRVVAVNTQLFLRIFVAYV